LEDDKQQILLNASIKYQEEERNRIAADLHDDVGPLLATARLYLNENMINLEPAAQLQSIFSAKQIIDDAIQLIRNISHSMMPPKANRKPSNPLPFLSSHVFKPVFKLSHSIKVFAVRPKKYMETINSAV
jgi:hypothetical protein